MRPFDRPSARLFRLFWQTCWFCAIPLAMLYLWLRGRKDPGYRKHIGERFGGGTHLSPGSIWIHAVSLGEVRSAVPLAKALLKMGHRITFTHATPAGRAEAMDTFAAEITQGRVDCRYLPMEQGWTYRRFLARVQPQVALVMEVEFWPVMIAAARRASVPIYLCNGQYPGKSFAKDPNWRKAIPSGFDAVMVKSRMMADRFTSVGCPDIHITGELRFAQPVPQFLLDQAALAPKDFDGPTIVFSSVVEGEDPVFIDAIKAHKDVRFIYVPRAPDRFETVYQMLNDAGLSVSRRSDAFDDLLTYKGEDVPAQVLLGDSLGEMYFYLSLADKVVVGGGFCPKGSHNIIETLQLGKPVAVGPNITTVEYPGIEAIAAGVCTHLMTPADLIAYCDPALATLADVDRRQTFIDQHAGAVEKTISVLTGDGLI